MSTDYRIAVIVGTRPEAIKLAPVSLALRRSAGVDVRIFSTGQHRELLTDALAAFDLTVDRTLDVMLPNQTLPQLVARLIPALDELFAAEVPDLVLVQGDTTSVFCASLCAFLRRIPVGHVEAGLRTHVRREPFPEELNRKLTADVADIHFAPTVDARANLLKEGISADSIFVTGNTAIDAVCLAAQNPRIRMAIPEGLATKLRDARQVVLITAHRRESFGAPLQQILAAVKDLARAFPAAHFVFPAHPNPNVQQPVHSALGNCDNVTITNPQGYLGFVALMERADFILSDSGGVQEEAPSLKKPVLILRDRTERPEVVTAGAAKLVGTDRRKIVDEASRLLLSDSARRAMTVDRNPCGDGRAAERIAQLSIGFLNRHARRLLVAESA